MTLIVQPFQHGRIYSGHCNCIENNVFSDSIVIIVNVFLFGHSKEMFVYAFFFVDEMRGLVHELHQAVQVVGPLVETIRGVHAQTRKKYFYY